MRLFPAKTSNMSNQTAIGLDPRLSEKRASKLNELLANYSFFYQNTRGFHWNIKGDKFFELHVKFEELYNDLWLKIDEIAERILTLGYAPKHNYSDYSKISEVKECKEISDGTKAIKNILDSFKTIIGIQREILALAEEDHDQGTKMLMSDYLRSQEKQVWMYSAFLA